MRGKSALWWLVVAVLMRVLAGILKVAQLLLLLLVAVLGAPDAELENARTSLRTAFRAGLRTPVPWFPQREAAAR